MKRIYKNNDLAFNLTINNFPINIELIESIEFRFYTINQSNYILKTQADINMYNQVLLSWDELKTLEEGVLYYDYTIKIKNDEMNDGTQDTVNKVMTNYFICTGTDNINIDNNNGGGNNVVDVDLTNYYTKSQVDNKLNNYVEDDVLGSYYTKSEVNDLIDNIDIPTGNTNVDLTNYYTKNEVNDLMDGIAIPPYEPDLSDYYTKDEVDDLIDGIVIPPYEPDLSDYYTKEEVNDLIPSTDGFIKEIPSEYITETELNDKGYATIDDILALRWEGTQDEYDALGEYDENIIYYIIEKEENNGGNWEL